MNPRGQTARFLIGCLLLTLASFSFPPAAETGIDLAGGGVSGTGVSTGSITGFGSVFMNGMEFFTDSNVGPGFVTKKTFMGMDNSSMADRDLFRVGMVVTIRHGANDNDARQIDYQDNLQGRIAAKNSGVENTVTVLGQTVVVSDAAVFASLNLNEIVEVSGFVDSARPYSRVLHRHGALLHDDGDVHRPRVRGQGIRFGPFFLRVSGSVRCPVGPGRPWRSRLPRWWARADRRDVRPGGHHGCAAGFRRDHRHPPSQLSPRTVFPEKAVATSKRLVTASPSGPGNVLSFAVDGKQVQTDGERQPPEHPAKIQPDVRVQIQGTQNGGVSRPGKIIFR